MLEQKRVDEIEKAISNYIKFLQEVGPSTTFVWIDELLEERDQLISIASSAKLILNASEGTEEWEKLEESVRVWEEGDICYVQE